MSPVKVKLRRRTSRDMAERRGFSRPICHSPDGFCCMIPPYSWLEGRASTIRPRSVNRVFACSCPDPRRGLRSASRLLRVQQAMEMDDHVFHVGVVHRELGLGPPGFLGRLVVGVNADDVEGREILELHPLRVADPPAEHEMKELLICQ